MRGREMMSPGVPALARFPQIPPLSIGIESHVATPRIPSLELDDGEEGPMSSEEVGTFSSDSSEGSSSDDSDGDEEPERPFDIDPPEPRRAPLTLQQVPPPRIPPPITEDMGAHPQQRFEGMLAFRAHHEQFSFPCSSLGIGPGPTQMLHASSAERDDDAASEYLYPDFAQARSERERRKGLQKRSGENAADIPQHPLPPTGSARAARAPPNEDDPVHLLQKQFIALAAHFPGLGASDNLLKLKQRRFDGRHGVAPRAETAFSPLGSAADERSRPPSQAGAEPAADYLKRYWGLLQGVLAEDERHKMAVKNAKRAGKSPSADVARAHSERQQQRKALLARVSAALVAGLQSVGQNAFDGDDEPAACDAGQSRPLLLARPGTRTYASVLREAGRELDAAVKEGTLAAGAFLSEAGGVAGHAAPQSRFFFGGAILWLLALALGGGAGLLFVVHGERQSPGRNAMRGSATEILAGNECGGGAVTIAAGQTEQVATTNLSDDDGEGYSTCCCAGTWLSIGGVVALASMVPPTLGGAARCKSDSRNLRHGKSPPSVDEVEEARNQDQQCAAEAHEVAHMLADAHEMIHGVAGASEDDETSSPHVTWSLVEPAVGGSTPPDHLRRENGNCSSN